MKKAILGLALVTSIATLSACGDETQKDYNQPIATKATPITPADYIVQIKR
jgi:predicted small lipoprotein YifL